MPDKFWPRLWSSMSFWFWLRKQKPPEGLLTEEADEKWENEERVDFEDVWGQWVGGLAATQLVEGELLSHLGDMIHITSYLLKGGYRNLFYSSIGPVGHNI